MPRAGTLEADGPGAPAPQLSRFAIHFNAPISCELKWSPVCTLVIFLIVTTTFLTTKAPLRDEAFVWLTVWEYSPPWREAGQQEVRHLCSWSHCVHQEAEQGDRLGKRCCPHLGRLFPPQLTADGYSLTGCRGACCQSCQPDSITQSHWENTVAALGRSTWLSLPSGLFLQRYQKCQKTSMNARGCF